MNEDIDFGAALEPQPEPEIMPAVVEYETQPVAAMLAQFDRQVALMAERARGIVIITDPETNKKAAEWGAQAKRLRKRLEELRKHVVEPHNKFLTAVNNFFKRYQEPLEEIERSLGRKIGAFRQLLEQERHKKQAEVEAEAKRLQKQLEDEASAAATPFEAAIVAAPVVPEVPHVTRTPDGTASQRKVWTFIIEDEGKIPREFLKVDEQKIRQAVRAGQREIPGVRIYEDYVTGFRV